MKKIKTSKIGLRKGTTATLWTLLICSVLFGAYKNFTAIDQHTIHEEKIIETKMVDTNFVSSYVEEFVQVFYTWEPTKEALDNRSEVLKDYLPEELYQLNQEMVRSDIPTTSIVEKVKIWKVEQVDSQDYKVLFSVQQRVEEKREEEVESKTVDSAYSLMVRTDGKSKISILSNPVMAALPQKLEIKSEVLQDDLSVTAKTKEEILQFLNTFFKAYPTADRTELHYYCVDSTIEEIGKEAYIFSDIKSINYFEAGKNVKVRVCVTYLDTQTKTSLNSVYELVLEKRDDKWIILSGI